MSEVNNIVDSIVNKINPTWSKLQKIRFVYLELGMMIEKNTDFFLNDKLGNYALSDEQIDKIYRDNYLFSRLNKNDNCQYQVICKSAAFLLKSVYDKLDINSELVCTTPEEDNLSDVRHWFLVAQDDEKKQYFLTLAADLPFIKNEFPTEHFASHLSFFSTDGKPNYVIPNDNKMLLKEVEDSISGKKDYEIDHIILEEEELSKLDESIGYSKLYDSKGLVSSFNYSVYFFEYCESNSDIYKIYKKCLGIDGSEKKSGYSIEVNSIDNFIIELNKYIYDNVGSKAEIVNKISKEIDDPIFNDEIDLFQFLKDNKKSINKIKDIETKELVEMLRYLFEVERRFLVLKESIVEKTNFYRNNKNKDDYDVIEHYKLSENHRKALNNISFPKISPILNRVAFYFIKDEIDVAEKKDYVSVDYVINKFLVMFPIVFDCNYMTNETVKSNSFSVQNYSEQIVIIKKLLSMIFKELTLKNCSEMDDYDENFSPVENRIQTFPLKNKETGEYAIGFRFGKKKDEDSPEYVYIPSENTLKTRNPIEDKKKYWICSRRFNSLLQNVEAMEEKLEPSNRIR